MASRQEEKERRRQEREAREQAEQASQSRRKRLQYVFGGLVAALVVAGGAFALTGVVGGDEKDPGKARPPSGGADIPPVQETNLEKAVKAAGCKLVKSPIEPSGHLDKEFAPGDYKDNPPTSGAHNPNWYQDGEYAPGDTPRLGELVHPLEHGRIELQYKPGTDAKVVSQLSTLMNESSGGYHMLLFENTTKMPYAVAASAWGAYVGCTTMNDKVFDAFRAFREEFIDKGPEVVP